MKTNSVILLVLWLAAWPFCCRGQGYISYDYLPESSLKDDLGNEYGSGSLMMVSGRYNLPLSVRHDDKGRLVAWSATVNAAYGVFHNKGQARELNPDNLLNASLNISHIRPLSDKWSIIASVGGGVYAPLDGVSMKTLLANGAIIFVYKLRKNLDLGIGAGLTNSYGIPMILPMMYFSWRNAGRYELKVDMSSGMKVSVATWLNKKLKLELTALDMDGMSAVMEVDGKSKIYSTVMLGSYISPSYQLSRKTAVYLGVGGNWIRGISMSDRSLKGFLNNFKNDEDEPCFRPTLRLTVGFRYTLK